MNSVQRFYEQTRVGRPNLPPWDELDDDGKTRVVAWYDQVKARADQLAEKYEVER